MPYVYTEQGISMLASVLHSEVAVNVSINHHALFGTWELPQILYQRFPEHGKAQCAHLPALLGDWGRRVF